MDFCSLRWSKGSRYKTCKPLSGQCNYVRLMVVDFRGCLRIITFRLNGGLGKFRQYDTKVRLWGIDLEVWRMGARRTNFLKKISLTQKFIRVNYLVKSVKTSIRRETSCPVWPYANQLVKWWLAKVLSIRKVKGHSAFRELGKWYESQMRKS